MDNANPHTSRILFVAHTAQVSGAEKVLLQLVQEALAGGLRVSVACPHGPLEDALPDGCDHRAIPMLGLSGQRGWSRAVGAARLAKAWWTAARMLAAPMREPGTRTVVNSLMALPAVRLARPPGGAIWLVHDTVAGRKARSLMRFGMPGVRRAVTMSEAASSPIREAALPVTVVPYGVAWPVPQLTRRAGSPPTVGIVALITPWKGHRVLLEAASTIPGLIVEIAGGPFPGGEMYLAELQARAQQSDLAGRVRFLGHVNVENVFSGWDAMISASTSPEAGPLSVLEAMSYGVPVIGSDLGGTREHLAGGVGLLVPPSDAAALAEAIACLIGDEQLRQRLAALGRQRIAERHDINRTLPAVLDELLR